MEKAKQTIGERIAAVTHGVIGFVVIGSMALAGLWLKDRVGPRDSVTLELAPDDIMMQLAQSKSYEIRCDKEGIVCGIALKDKR